MLDALKSLFENNVVSEEIRADIEAAWNNKIQENRELVTQQLREEFAQKYEHDKQTMVEAIDQMLSEGLASEIADFNHTAEKPDFNGGSITAALFLEHFAGTRKWVHLDIAGPARSENDSGENPKGGTGFGVRLLTEWLTSL